MPVTKHLTVAKVLNLPCLKLFPSKHSCQSTEHTLNLIKYERKKNEEEETEANIKELKETLLILVIIQREIKTL